MRARLSGLGLVILLAFPTAYAEDKVESAIDKRIEKEVATFNNPFVITPHKPTYILPINYTSNSNSTLYNDIDLQDVEIKFQFSFKMPLVVNIDDSNLSIFFAYSQVSFWQAYNSEYSSPFRETNYEPELFVNWLTEVDLPLGWKARGLDVSFAHQSNGRSAPVSRSWNRVQSRIYFENGNWAFALQPWYRLKEDDEQDDNPDLLDYLGHGQFRVAYKLGGHTLSAMSRNNLESGFSKGAAEFSWSFPISQRLKGYVQVFSGYGNNLIEYNHYTNTVGIGFALTDWL